MISINVGLAEQSWPVPTDPLVIDNRNCQFEPYISGAQLGQPIEITNSDPILHNAHVLPSARGNREINLAQLPNGKPVRLSFPEADEAVRIKCDVHPWMFAYVSVFKHPFFAVTDAHGNFEIKNVPAGIYTISARHRKAGAHEMVVKVTDDTSPEMKFKFEVPAKD